MWQPGRRKRKLTRRELNREKPKRTLSRISSVLEGDDYIEQTRAWHKRVIKPGKRRRRPIRKLRFFERDDATMPRTIVFHRGMRKVY